MSAIVAHEARRRIDRERCTRDDEHVGLLNVLHRAIECLFVQSLFVEHHVGLDTPAAGAARHALRMLDVGHVVELAALLAVVAQGASVQLEDILAARRLMQPVDILRDDGLELPFLFPLGEL